jgi:hypothetical protein
MADQLSLRGGTTAEHAVFTGANKEVTVDTTKKTLVVNDGATVGGHPLMRENASNSALALGSAATPSLKFTGDTNTGIYSPGADQVAISTNGTGRLFVDASGRVGVGTASPGQTFDVAGTIAQTVFGTTRLRLENTLVGTYYDIRNDGNLFVTNGGIERLRITSAGLVGVGTSVPNSVLHIEAPKGTAQLTIGNTALAASDGDFLAGIDFHIKDNNDATGAVCTSIRSIADQNHTLTAKGTALAFSTTPDDTTTLIERLRIDQAGRLGIGTTPSGNLQQSCNNISRYLS